MLTWHGSSRGRDDVEQQVSGFFVLALLFINLRETKIRTFRSYNFGVHLRNLGIESGSFIKFAVAFLRLRQRELREYGGFAAASAQ